MEQEIVKQTKDAFEDSLLYVKEEVGKLRTSRAQSSLVEGITFELYGTTMKIQEAGTISIPSPNMLVIQPWDKNALEPMGRAISSSGLELNPVIDGETIRLVFPPMNEERRKEFLKIVREKAEQARIGIRNKREEALRALKGIEGKEGVSEDALFRARSEIQKRVEDYNKKIKELEEAKEKEIMTV